MNRAHIRRPARSFAISSKKSLWTSKKKERRGAKLSTSRPRASATPLLLLRRPQRLLRGDREAPCRATDVGAVHEGALRRDEARVDAPAHPHPDRRGLGDRAAAAQQRRPRRPPGARRRARWRAVAPHELV